MKKALPVFPVLLTLGAVLGCRGGLKSAAPPPPAAPTTIASMPATALTHALAASLAGRVRANSISPGWIDTSFREYDGPDAAQHFAGRVGNPMDIANMVLYLASDKAGFITGENICIDGGMTRNMIYHGDNGWSLGK